MFVNNLRSILRLLPQVRHSQLLLHNSASRLINFAALQRAPNCNIAKTLEAKVPLAKIELKLHISFTCNVCTTRNHKQMSKVAYEQGVVIMECTGCNNNHLIADNLNWFTDLNGKRNIEDILKEKGETVTKIVSDEAGNVEVINNK